MWFSVEFVVSDHTVEQTAGAEAGAVTPTQIDLIGPSDHAH